MSTNEYIRQAAQKNHWRKYYSLLRPVSLGTAPKSGMMNFINYDDRMEIRANNGVVQTWAELYYNRELTEQELKEYELVIGRTEVETYGNKCYIMERVKEAA